MAGPAPAISFRATDEGRPTAGLVNGFASAKLKPSDSADVRAIAAAQASAILARSAEPQSSGDLKMDRRVVLAGLAASAFAVPALAQTGGATTAQPGAAGTAGGTMNRAGGAMSQADMQHMQQTMMLGMVAMQTSQVAMQKAQNADLKRFAQFEVAEQQTVSEVLRSMMDPSATAAMGTAGGQPAAGQAAGGAMPMSAEGRQMVEKLQQASGAEFDKQYLQGQIQGHRDLLQVQERYLQGNPQNREHMNVAKMARGHIREHIAMLEEIQTKMR
jgi:putative membrane protein